MQQQKEGLKLTKEQALTKAEHFCAYQERSQQEVRDKLYEFGLHHAEVEELISTLIEANFLNEERFAIGYSMGKFRIKKWGKLKIKQGLKFKRVPDKIINKAVAAIDPDEYYEAMASLLNKKEAVLVEKDQFKRKYKLSQYLAGKGYERDLINDLLNNNKLT
jgi:regulatory protein